MNKKNSKFFFELETKLHRKEVRNSPGEISELLAEDLVGLGGSGRVYDKKSVLKALQTEQADRQIKVSRFTAKYPSKDVALIT